MHHLIKENRQLKQMLNAANSKINEPAPDHEGTISQLREELNMLKR
jgi:hypothetical protein